MDDIIERIGECCNLLEDATEELDWDLVARVIKKLDELYEELDRSSSSFGFDYD